MPAIGNFSAWVQVDSQKLNEYRVEYSQDGSKVTCWIPSEAGKKFEVCYQDSTRAIATGTSLTVDGTRCRGKILHERRNDNRRPKDTVTHRGLILSGNSIRPYFFSNCDLVENESDGLATNISALGEIKLSVYEVLPGEYKSHNPRPGLPPLQIYERAKKGIVHGTQLGEPEKTHRQPCRSAARQRKLVSFVFKYRPIDVLIASDIAPPLRNATHSSSSRDVIDLTVDDEVECTTKNNTKRLRRMSVKNEIKRERSVTFDNVVIDLTV